MVPVTFLRFVLPSAESLRVVPPTACQLLEGRGRRRRKGLGFAPGLLWLRHLSGRRRFPAGVVTPVGSCSISGAADPSAPDCCCRPGALSHLPAPSPPFVHPLLSWLPLPVASLFISLPRSRADCHGHVRLSPLSSHSVFFFPLSLSLMTYHRISHGSGAGNR